MDAALLLARRARMTINRVAEGGASLREFPYGAYLDVGPDATADAIAQIVSRYSARFCAAPTFAS